MKNFDIGDFILKHLRLFASILFIASFVLIIFLGSSTGYQAYMETKLGDLKLYHIFTLTIFHAVVSGLWSNMK